MSFAVFSYTHVLIPLKSLQIHITQSIKLRGCDCHVAVKTPTHCTPNSSPKPAWLYSVLCQSVGGLRSHYSRYLQIFLAYNTKANTKCNEK